MISNNSSFYNSRMYCIDSYICISCLFHPNNYIFSIATIQRYSDPKKLEKIVTYEGKSSSMMQPMVVVLWGCSSLNQKSGDSSLRYEKNFGRKCFPRIDPTWCGSRKKKVVAWCVYSTNSANKSCHDSKSMAKSNSLVSYMSLSFGIEFMCELSNQSYNWVARKTDY